MKSFISPTTFRITTLFFGMVGMFGAFAFAEIPAHAAPLGHTFVVTMVNEGNDANVGDGICAVKTGGCSLRAAMQEANYDAAQDTIHFNLPGGGMHVMSISEPLPFIPRSVILDGTSQPNCTVPCVVISGANVTISSDGFSLQASYSTIKGFIITSWDGAGIYMSGNNNLIQSNDIGFWPGNPTDLHNGYGVAIEGSNNLIGGGPARLRNKIGNNLYGIVIWSRSAAIPLNNRLKRNSIYGTTYPAIDLGFDGVTPNDALDADTGPNGLQNFPIVLSANSTTRSISARLRSAPNQTYTIEFFSVANCDASGHGAGKSFLGDIAVTTTDSGRKDFSLTTRAFSSGESITATATDANGNTSEFSACHTAN